ncbi:hypothetical protein C8J57DRAFT_1628267 [Mycena rebaudengoi]|nr:hypothetical protein C8J57DRAFT_1628267 [Mycena rebaudengoi]
MSTPWPILSYFFTLLCPPGDCTLCTITSLRSTNPRTPCTFFAHPSRISRRARRASFAHQWLWGSFASATLATQYRFYAFPHASTAFGGAAPGYEHAYSPDPAAPTVCRACAVQAPFRASATFQATCPRLHVHQHRHHSDAARAEGWEGCVARVRPRAVGVRGVTKRGHGVGCEADRDDAAAARARCMPPRAPAPPSAVLLRRTGSAAAWVYEGTARRRKRVKNSAGYGTY